MDQQAIINQVRESACFKAEAGSMARGGFHVAEGARLFKPLENNLVRLVFPTTLREIDEGSVIALVCLYDLKTEANTYAHPIFAGASVNAALRSLYNPPTQAKPQPGVKGNRAILKFVAWKQAAWGKFLNEELEMGTERASSIWIESFWKALDRMYGGGNLLPQPS